MPTVVSAQETAFDPVNHRLPVPNRSEGRSRYLNGRGDILTKEAFRGTQPVIPCCLRIRWSAKEPSLHLVKLLASQQAFFQQVGQLGQLLNG
jgi:hypothetical protein